MNPLRVWPFVMALVASTGVLLGAITDWQALVCDRGSNELYPIDLPLNQPPSVESPFAGITRPAFVAITPDATRAIVTSLNSSPNPCTFSMDLTTNPISIAGSTGLVDGPGSIALTPDGAKIYVSENILNIKVLKTSDLSLIATIPNSEFLGNPPLQLAISPTRPEGYASTGSNVVYVFDTNTNHVTGTYPLPSGSSFGIAVTPNGSEVYVGDINSNKIFYITVSDGSVHTITGMATAAQTQGIVIAPDGTAVYAVQIIGAGGGVLTKIDTSTHAVVGEFAIPSELSGPKYIAITPDGKTVYIADVGTTDPAQYAAYIDTASGSSSILQISTSQYSAQLGIAITPDQAPTARFTSTISRATVTFDGSTSSSPIGSIATYAWDFGDGQTSTTSSPTTSHAYSASGTFTVTLTVTNTAGTSTELTFTGKTASNNGGPSAVTTQQITVQIIGVDKFKGKVHLHHKKKKVYLKTKWSKSLVANTTKYEIYARNTKIATVKAGQKRHKTLRLHPHHFPNKISKDYRHYLDHKYNIRVVNSLGHISQPTFVHVTKH
jgi:DNA-binding beta-propeller fold protein YncE